MNTEPCSTSPSGRYIVTVSPWEARMSLWVETPTVTDSVTRERLVDFQDGNWSLNSAEWVNDSTVVLKLRKFPGNHSPTEVTAVVDCASKSAVVEGVATDKLRDVERLLDKALTTVSRLP